MKITTQKIEEGFKPVSFTITCESQGELNFWAAIIDSVPIQQAAGKFGVAFRETAQVIGFNGGTVQFTSILHKSLKENV